MKRPNLEEALKPLKPFQRRTVDHAFERLFLAEDSTARFLVADEVGLGKTLVARGIIAKAIDHLWEDVERIDIVYICSNGSIARANLPKLHIGDGEDHSLGLATRLTLLATQLSTSKLLDSKLNFVSFTPGTSFKLGRSAGMRREREVLFHMLVTEFEREIPLMNLLQGGVKRKNDWRWRLKSAKWRPEIDPRISEKFLCEYRNHPWLEAKIDEATDTWFSRYKASPPWEAIRAQNKIIGELRQTLARVCVDALEPDLVILDEFQRFKPLLESREEHKGEAARLAQSLFNAELPEGGPVRTLLLSATPYKVYTSDAEIEHEDHYKDFLGTTRFLFDDDPDDPARVNALQRDLAQFATCLKRMDSTDDSSYDRARTAKSAAEGTLRKVMARTERTTASSERDAMLREHKPHLVVNPEDVRQYMAANAMFRAVGDRDPMALWKSAPYLVNFMHGYRFNDRLVETRVNSPDQVREVLLDHREDFLTKRHIEHWSPLDCAHAKMRALVETHLDSGLWRLLWLPPTLPYWPLEGAFARAPEATKTLLFSAWNVVPDVVSGLLSYEAERRMVSGQIENYLKPGEQQGPLLQLTESGAHDRSRRSRHRLLHLLLPCLPLADKAHPLSAPAGMDKRAWVREQVGQLLSELPNPDRDAVDPRWEWAAPILLDSGLRTFLAKWRTGVAFGDEDLTKPNPEHFDAYLDDLLNIDLSELGRRPPNLEGILTEIALGSPAVLALRTLGMHAAVSEEKRRLLAVKIANSFWSLFNRPAVISLLRGLGASGRDSGTQPTYWRQVLDYCQAGNLQSVIDEQWHILWEQQAWSEDRDADEVATKCATHLATAVAPLPSRVHARSLEVNQAGGVELDQFRLRTIFALRFGHLSGEDDQAISQDRVRMAFNSPFRPFVLASTSVGQEGLDFHPWCHRVVHWNLPGNPVDLEQREGRVHRYKGHAVRRNLAEKHGQAALGHWRAGEDIWQKIFEFGDHAARQSGQPDMVPCWIAPGRYRVERQVPLLPYSSEAAAFERLKRQLAAYRVVFGQPRQEELLSLLDASNLSLERLQSLTIDLTPTALGQVKE